MCGIGWHQPCSGARKQHQSQPYPPTKKGRIRVELECRLRSLAKQGGRALIVRAGDFFGPQAGNNWFAQGLIKPRQAVDRIRYPGRKSIDHQWSYIPDVARGMVALIETRDASQPFETFHMAGHWDRDGRQMVLAICRVAARHGGAAPEVSAFPWWLLKLASPFNTTFKELQEMRYLWRQPIRMESAKLRARLGHEPLPPWDEAVEATLLGQPCCGA
ncbi:hypothetical protein [Chromobacterium sphagni]|uniref:NAD-dependent epimerase/dehydratase domain-containing protein n=1 Tax=Chromobacterium sphagni TaxID=1903179 RepID=A0ABX3CBU6_9NEIS|nr:hypothetical protein [Chromobacterium sphagni]OHX19643.1 hypothetical protein BI344_17345 [Chromobacterium sphagni]